MSDQEEKLTQFRAITGAPLDRAKFFLESSAWQVEVAITRYYENESSDDVELIEPSDETPRAQRTSKTSYSSNIATFNTLTTSSDEEEEGQAYYAGGSDRSGQQIIGPPKKKKDIVSDLFKSVQEHGVEIVDPNTAAAASSSNRSFRGTGYKLGQDDDDECEIIPGAAEPPSPAHATLRLWQNGFSLNDGELRLYTDQANKEFLKSVRKGEIPAELRQGNVEVDLAVEDHSKEQYRQVERRGVRSFQGQGYTLGSPAPQLVVPGGNKNDQNTNEANAKENVNVDKDKPTTNLQIRLADGSRLVGQFNQTHTIATVRSFIANARPQYQNQPFNLLSSYPSKILDDSQTLLEAGLLNAAIMQKLI